MGGLNTFINQQIERKSPYGEYTLKFAFNILLRLIVECEILKTLRFCVKNCWRYFFSLSDSFEDLNTGHILADDFHGLDDVIGVELASHLRALIALFLGRLDRDQLVACNGIAYVKAHCNIRSVRFAHVLHFAFRSLSWFWVTSVSFPKCNLMQKTHEGNFSHHSLYTKVRFREKALDMKSPMICWSHGNAYEKKPFSLLHISKYANEGRPVNQCIRYLLGWPQRWRLFRPERYARTPSPTRRTRPCSSRPSTSWSSKRRSPRTPEQNILSFFPSLFVSLFLS